MHIFRSFLREPLLHFLAIGLVLFVSFSVLNENTESETGQKRVETTVGETKQLIEQFRKTWSRPPTLGELNALIEAKIEEHILVQEALALSMDQGDAVIRQRLRQKMNFLIASAAKAEVPQEAVLQTFYEANIDRYTPLPRFGFQQVYLGDAVEQNAIDEVLKALNSGANPSDVGRPILLPSELPLSTKSSVDGTFGPDFFASLAALEPGRWQGPIRSGFGLHLVLVLKVEAKPVPEFGTIREDVLVDFRRVREKELEDAVLQKLLTKYEVTTPDAATRAELLQ